MVKYYFSNVKIIMTSCEQVAFMLYVIVCHRIKKNKLMCKFMFEYCLASLLFTNNTQLFVIIVALDDKGLVSLK